METMKDSDGNSKECTREKALISLGNKASKELLFLVTMGLVLVSVYTWSVRSAKPLQELSTQSNVTVHQLLNHTENLTLHLLDENRNKNKTETTDNDHTEKPVQEPQSRVIAPAKVWIHVVNWAEGMAGWRGSFAELLTVAKAYGAVLVEPCVEAGRLKSCERTKGEGLLSQLFEMHPYRKLGLLASHDEFVQETGYSIQKAHQQIKGAPHRRNNNATSFQVYPFCLNKFAGTVPFSCRTLNVECTFRRGDQIQLDQALQQVQDPTYPYQHAILNILEYRQWGLTEWHHNGQKVIDERQKQTFLLQMRHPTTAFAQVRKMLHSLNITAATENATAIEENGDNNQTLPPFAAIQWRPELNDMDFWDCANAILKTRDIISAQHGIPKSNFVLMSPLSHRKELMWAGVANIADRPGSRAYESLQLLLDHGFRRLEQAFGSEVTDGSVVAVWDLILATQAEIFTTCSGCYSFCARCNYQGKASRLALELRREMKGHNAPTNKCWPES